MFRSRFSSYSYCFPCLTLVQNQQQWSSAFSQHAHTYVASFVRPTLFELLCCNVHTEENKPNNSNKRERWRGAILPYASLAYSSNDWSSSAWRTRLHYFSVRLTTIRKEYLEWSGANAVGGGGGEVNSPTRFALFETKSFIQHLCVLRL